MKTLRAIVSVLVLTAFSAAFAQQAIAPPPKPNKGPSLAETMQLIQKELNAFGKANFIVNTRDELGGPDHIAQYTTEISNVVSDSASCTVRYHWKSSTKDQVSDDEDFSLNLHDVQGIKVMTYVQYLKEVEGEDIGDPHDQTNWYTKFNPPMIVLFPQLAGDKTGEYGFIFADEGIANRIAKVLTHAVELCGGGNKEPF
jgi:hypothetical protein